MVESTLRFLMEQVGQVDGVYPAEGKLAENFLLQRTLGDGIDLTGIVAFHASPHTCARRRANSPAHRSLTERLLLRKRGA
jgi:hypothetical protein